MHRNTWKMVIVLPLLLTGCAHHTRRAPALTEPAAEGAAPEEMGILSRTADATWNVVSAPVRLVTPSKAAAPQAPVVYEAPEAVIMTPSMIADEPAATRSQ